MQKGFQSSQELAASITRAGSKHAYYMLRFLADRQRVSDAYRAYAYFRWIDDQIDEAALAKSEQVAFMERQKALMESCYHGQKPGNLAAEEQMLADLILADHEENSGLQSYIRNMMAVIDFDAGRRGRVISRLELSTYTAALVVAVTDVMHYFIGHDQPAPKSEGRYMAVTGAHITHLLRDTVEDIQAGYYNIPREYLTAKGIGPQEVESEPYREWVRERANLARAYFKSGKQYLAQLKSIRLRIAGYAYVARFEANLDAIERNDYRLAPESTQVKGLSARVRISGPALALALFPPRRN